MARKPVIIKKVKKIALPARECAACSKVFVPTRTDQIYHSDKCREFYYDLKYHRRASDGDKVCEYCHKTFDTRNLHKQKYCNSTCRDAAQAEERKRKAYLVQKLLKENDNG
jgi:predicted nucleic acid-binding Zn ribbon protein